ncbi:MAG TPA: ACP phosphodiesterase [Flavisolibacter sp.]|nr:ACP phosphodiesterase [Flavisolibacter sp.]
MNYLAHAYLSFNDPQILAGNMISDYVKGRAQFSFSGKIQKGIMLHREIDQFTDTHPATKKAKEIFRPAYRLYSGAIMDVLYDHFLANDGTEFTPASLKDFAARTYRQLELQAADLPINFLQVFTYMKTYDWLYNYRSLDGMSRSLAGLVRRSAYLSESATAYNLFTEHYVFLNGCYHEFFQDVKQFAKDQFDSLL